MNEDVAAALSQAKAQLSQRSDGHLPRPVRLVVLGALGVNDPADAAAYPRVVARVAAVRLVLGHWSSARPDDGRPELLVRAAISSPETVQAAEPRADELRAEILDDLFDEMPESSSYAGVAATILITEALYPDDELELDDDDLDPEQWNSEFVAALAAAGGDATDAETAARRRAFWLWWLDEAVPAAAKAGPRPD